MKEPMANTMILTAYIQIDRILEVDGPEEQDGRETPTEDNNWGIVMDPEDEGYDKGAGRQFLVKWCSLSLYYYSYLYQSFTQAHFKY